MRRKVKRIVPFIVFLFVMSLIVFTAGIEYKRSYQNHVKETEDQVLHIKLNLENLIASRMVAIQGLKAYVEINPNFNQRDFNHFAKAIYELSNDVVQSISFITENTITHVYPYNPYKNLLGTDLSLNEEQKDCIYYIKERKKTVIDAPVNLVEGGRGIILHIPVMKNDKYFGQVSIVFNYEKILSASGLSAIAENNYIELNQVNDFKNELQTIWTNDDTSMLNNEKTIFAQVNLYESEMLLKIIPKDGFSGKSVLFYLIITIGGVIALGTSLIVCKLLKTALALGNSEKELKENNHELEAMVNQLRANEETLYNQFDEIKKQNDYIKVLADCDYLTNLYNRRKFAVDLTERIAKDNKGTILLFDIDNFKNINDTHGHLYGDKVLMHIAAVLKKTEDREKVCKNAVFYRTGGDEFTIHLPEIIESKEIETYIKLLFKDLKTNNFIEKIKNNITVSLGIARYPKDALTSDDLLIKSDIAMYQAKKKGKNRYCYFTDVLISDFDYNIKIEKKLWNVLEEGKFKLLYQPIVDNKSGEISSLEALIRIEDSSLSPSEFIAIAENSELIILIGHWVIDQVCFQLNEWKKEGATIKPVAINVSVKQLYDDSIIEYIKEALDRYNLSSEFLEIEITESVLFDNSEDMIKILSTLRIMGHSISLDDFGTGYSSLNYLTYMPIDKVKIDKSLKDEFLFLENKDVMQGIISICHGLEMNVVTEGVETKEEYERLREYNADYTQGYYFEKPISSDKILILLKNNYNYIIAKLI